MPDLEDYLLTGVMNGNPFGIDLPFNPWDLEIEALEMADRFIDEYRRKNRAFDAACDPDARAWTWHHLPFEKLRPGLVVSTSVKHCFPHRPRSGRIESINQRGDVELRGEPYGFPERDWDDTSRVLVPLPTDLSTLGLYPNGDFDE